jgi:chromate reductase
MRVLAVSGSLQAKSANRALLARAVELAPADMQVTAFDGLRDLPHFDPDLELAGTLPVVDAWRTAITSNDALLIACPEYGHSLPGVLKNGVDWVIGSGELECKLIAVTAATVSMERGLLGLAALCQTLGAVRARIVGGEPIARGIGADDALRALLADLLAAGVSEK